MLRETVNTPAKWAGLLWVLLQGCSATQAPLLTATKAEKPAEQILFDDFSYTDSTLFNSNGWNVRTETGHPGVTGATWSAAGISFHEDVENTGNRIVRMSSHTDGTGANTQHTQFCHERKYREGTYAARVRFRDTPTFGPDGDEIIETFYAISPLKAPMNPDYSEADFEYLANGGWGEPSSALWATTWETFQLEPWTKDNRFSLTKGSFDGWHTLVLQIADNKVRYFVNGKLFAEHGGHVYPEEPMSINFNLWFTQEGLLKSNEMRQYQEDVDWVFFQANAVLSAEQVEQKVAALRVQNIAFRDTVPAWTPALPSPCGL